MDVQPSDVVRDLGVLLLDSELALKHHVNRTAGTCFYHLHTAQAQAAETSRRSRGYEAANQLLHFSRLDYCNALLIGLPFSTKLFATGPERRRITSTSGIVAV